MQSPPLGPDPREEEPPPVTPPRPCRLPDRPKSNHVGWNTAGHDIDWTHETYLRRMRLRSHGKVDR